MSAEMPLVDASLALRRLGEVRRRSICGRCGMQRRSSAHDVDRQLAAPCFARHEAEVCAARVAGDSHNRVNRALDLRPEVALESFHVPKIDLRTEQVQLFEHGALHVRQGYSITRSLVSSIGLLML